MFAEKPLLSDFREEIELVTYQPGEGYMFHLKKKYEKQ